MNTCYKQTIRIYSVTKKVGMHPMITIQKFKINFKSAPPPPPSHQTFIDTPNCVLEDCVRCSTVRIQYVIIVK
jgi:hypothetical protein